MVFLEYSMTISSPSSHQTHQKNSLQSYLEFYCIGYHTSSAQFGHYKLQNSHAHCLHSSCTKKSCANNPVIEGPFLVLSNGKNMLAKIIVLRLTMEIHKNVIIHPIINTHSILRAKKAIITQNILSTGHHQEYNNCYQGLQHACKTIIVRRRRN